MIWEADHSDVPELVKMGRIFHSVSGMLSPFDAVAFSEALHGMIHRGDAVVYRSKDGMIGGMLSPSYLDPKHVIAVEMFWWARGSGLALLRGFEEWAKGRASEVRMTSISTLKRAGTLLERKGYNPAEISYSKVI